MDQTFSLIVLVGTALVLPAAFTSLVFPRFGAPLLLVFLAIRLANNPATTAPRIPTVLSIPEMIDWVRTYFLALRSRNRTHEAQSDPRSEVITEYEPGTGELSTPATGKAKSSAAAKGKK